MSASGAGRRLSDSGWERREVVEPDGCDPAGVPWGFSGRVVVEQTWTEVAWPLVAVATPSAVALGAFWATGSSGVMLWTGTVLGVVALVVDYRRTGRRAEGLDGRHETPAADLEAAAPEVEASEQWGWSCLACGIDSTPVVCEVEAADLAGIHDLLHHGGRPSAWLWTGAAGTGAASSRDAA